MRVTQSPDAISAFAPSSLGTMRSGCPFSLGTMRTAYAFPFKGKDAV